MGVTAVPQSAATQDVMFRLSRPVPEEWQRDLERIVPRTDRVNWLQIVWQAGLEYEPVQRFELYEMQPRLDFVPDGILESLQGPNPREWGHWAKDRESPTGKRWITDSLVSLTQWQLYRDTRCFGQRWWIIQGDRGGHKWRLTHLEKALLTQQGYDDEIDTPLPGALPYAEWDNRVAEQIGRADRLRQWREQIAWDDRQATKHSAAAFIERERDALRRQYAAETLQWLDAQVGAAVSDIPRRVAAKIMGQAPVGDGSYNKDAELIERGFTEWGTYSYGNS